MSASLPPLAATLKGLAGESTRSR